MSTIIYDILKIENGEELFGDLSEEEAEEKYHSLQEEINPDLWSDEMENYNATLAYIYLTGLWEQCFGEEGKQDTVNDVIETQRHTYNLKGSWWNTDGFDTQIAGYDGTIWPHAYIAVPLDERDNDLNSNAALKLQRIRKEIPSEYLAFYPEILESFKIKSNDKKIQYFSTGMPDNLYSLREALTENPNGLNGRDIAWIYKRILVAIGNAHEIGIVHGGINLDSILIEPELHGLLLTNWQYSIEVGERMKAYPKSAKAYYPSYVFKKEPVSADLDICLAAQTMMELGGVVLPKPMYGFFKATATPSQPSAKELLAEFDQLLFRLYGEPKFNKFEIKNKRTF